MQFTAEDFDQVVDGGNFVTKVIYLPDPKYQELAVSGVETLVSTRLEPGVDPILEADKRGTILLIVRLGAIDLETPGFGWRAAPVTGAVPPRATRSSVALRAPSWHRVRLPPGVAFAPSALAPANGRSRPQRRRPRRLRLRPDSVAPPNPAPTTPPPASNRGTRRVRVGSLNQSGVDVGIEPEPSRASEAEHPGGSVYGTRSVGVFGARFQSTLELCPSRKTDDEPPRKEWRRLRRTAASVAAAAGRAHDRLALRRRGSRRHPRLPRPQKPPAQSVAAGGSGRLSHAGAERPRSRWSPPGNAGRFRPCVGPAGLPRSRSRSPGRAVPGPAGTGRRGLGSGADAGVRSATAVGSSRSGSNAESAIGCGSRASPSVPAPSFFP